MLRLLFLGLLMLLGVGVLSAMELRTPPRRAAAIVQSPAEPSARVSASHDALAKADRLEVAAVSSERSTQTASVEERIAPPEDVSIGSSEPSKAVARQRHNRDRISAASRPKPKPKASVVKRTAISEPAKAVSHTKACRLEAFGGLRRALNISGCEI
jgi:hypothetical protein